MSAVRALLRVTSAALIATGSASWYLVTKELRSQRITLPPDSPYLAGKQVAGPLTAYAESVVIERHAMKGSGGKTYAEVSEEAMAARKAGDTEAAETLAKKRLTLMQANLLRASLLTSVLACGVSALAVGAGVALAGVTSQLKE